jgi:lysozyme
VSGETTIPKTPADHVLVIDVSRFQGQAFDFVAASSAGAVGAIVKATEGASYVDPAYELDARTAAAAGLQVGSYHVFHPDQDPEEQAKHYRAIAFDRTALCPVIDFELASKQLATFDVARRAAAFVEATRLLWNKVHGLVYASPSFLASLVVTGAGAEAIASMASAWRLWVAHYGVAKPLIPKPWTDYAGWQFSGGDHRVAGVPVDLSWFRGDERALAELGATR